MRLPCRKLSPRFIGPFTITQQVNPVTYRLQLPPEYKIHPVFHVSLLKPHHPSVFPPTEPGEAEEPSPPLIMDEGSAYLVRDILDSRRHGGRLDYLVIRPPRRRSPRSSGADRRGGGNVTDTPGSPHTLSQRTPSPEF
ncbi:hypothetical protein QTP70_011524 [Hemibagrus guttatus]|uniref:Tf2-1-like SH3-like domain-containing protein n=1 Tax=Hemibagrus guttatus TaxID=175788 RepID=A0AAE0VBJ3_9TELE|nr:hypothetical protein QTP70_011524 [Hemibagrus guttatus]KAK3571457.1 hypothetical protein QTP86_012084 [Hemibagrus guttatus]